MERLLIEATKYTPSIISSLDDCSITISGKSYPENTFEFYEPIEEYIENFITFFKTKVITVNFNIEYFNSSSSKVFFNILDMFEESTSGTIINWYYDKDNETMKEAGEDFAEDFESLKFNIVAK